jgi:hypothetical protein
MPVLIAYLLGFLTGIKRIDSANKAKNSQDQSGDSLPVLRAKFDISTAVEAEKRAKNGKKNGLEFYLAFIHTATMLAVVWYACINSRMLDKMKESTDTAHDALIFSERPWITVAITLDEPPHAHSPGPGFFFNPDGTASLNAFVTVKNIGHSIATSIYISPQMYSPAFENILTEPIDRQYLCCDKVRRQTSMDTRKLISLFPGEERTENFTFSMSKQDIQAAMKSGSFINQTHIIPVIYGCVNYNSGLFKDVRQTPFLYEMNPLRVVPGVVPASGLEFIKISRGKAPD